MNDYFITTVVEYTQENKVLGKTRKVKIPLNTTAALDWIRKNVDYKAVQRWSFVCEADSALCLYYY